MFSSFSVAQKHVEYCGEILEKCPNKCVAYVERKLMIEHLQECPKTSTNQLTNKIMKNDDTRQQSFDKIFLFEQNLITLRSALNEEIRQRHRMITDVGDVRRQSQNTDICIEKMSGILNVLKNCLAEETERRALEIQSCKEEIDRLDYQYQVNKQKTIFIPHFGILFDYFFLSSLSSVFIVSSFTRSRALLFRTYFCLVCVGVFFR